MKLTPCQWVARAPYEETGAIEGGMMPKSMNPELSRLNTALEAKKAELLISVLRSLTAVEQD